ncbi:hypothetical protein HK098_008203 [Nowakowskiella sp. JEL0407]|nr:hypothetical protein HK098_008203 [Nowakowskiella sp. JEL0407]
MSQVYAKDQPKDFQNHIRKIAIVGAGGQMGKFIVDALLANGTQTITAVTRKGSSNKIPEGLTVKEVDYDDHASLVSALQGQDALIITMGVIAPPDQSAKLIKAAAEANIPWIIPNEFGADGSNEVLSKDSMLGAAKKADRDLIESLGKSWIGIACNFWYEFSLGGGEGRYGFDFRNKTVLFYDDGEEKIPTATWPLTAKAVANLLALKVYPDDENDTSLTLDSYRNKFVNVKSFNVSQKDMLASVLRVTGDSIDDWKITNVKVEEYFMKYLQQLQKGDRPAFVRVLYSRFFFKGTSASITNFDNEKLGLPVEDLDEFTKVALEMDKQHYFEKKYGHEV